MRANRSVPAGADFVELTPLAKRRLDALTTYMRVQGDAPYSTSQILERTIALARPHPDIDIIGYPEPLYVCYRRQGRSMRASPCGVTTKDAIEMVLHHATHIA